MHATPIDVRDEAQEAPESPQMRQYRTLCGRAIHALEAQQKAEATASISATLTQGEKAAPRPAHLRSLTPQMQIDYIRSLAHKSDAERQAWMDRWIRDEVTNTLERLDRKEYVSKLAVGEVLVAGLVNPEYMPEGQLGPVFAKTAQRFNQHDFFKHSIVGAQRNGMIPLSMTPEQAEKAMWQIYNTIAITD
ncbi:hypothetical protein KA517_01150 [Candidatus Gracilibacteria bacterium]|nr:hypothetical protein [Candidatus Gracilibacteria bacterium]